MWTKLAHIVLKNRFFLIIALGLITVFMGIKSQEVQWSTDYSAVVPANDPEMIYFREFKQSFGEDGNVLALGIRDSSLYTPLNFRRFKYLSEEIARIAGVNYVLSLPILRALEKDTEKRVFVFNPIFDEIPEDQQSLDSLLRFAARQRFYSDQLINMENGATFIMVSIEKDVLNSIKRDQVIGDIKDAGEVFEKHTGINLHYVGLPYIRTEVNSNLKKEIQIFLALSLLISALILWFFFKSWDAVIFPIIVVVTVVIWSTGTLALFGYKITLLTGLLPPIIAVIAIPNSIYLLNKYHQEISKHGNKMKALSVVIRKIGLATLITNFTTSVGFLVLGFTQIVILREFGIVAGINVLAAFFVSIILIPAVFSYLPAPHGKQLKHLDFRFVNYTLSKIDLIVHRQRYTVLVVTAIILAISVVGILKLKAVAFIVDDVPEDGKVKKDLLFFEENFSGIMPLEIVIDTKKPKGVMRSETLEKIDVFETTLAENQYISNPVSMISMLKGARQAFYNGNPAYYDLPNNQDRNFILRYLRGNSQNDSLLNNFIDSTQQIMRISYRVADVGSIALDSLIQHVVQKNIDDIFGDSEIEVKATGTTLLFVKGNKFLVENLYMSMALAFMIISLIMGFLFRSHKMIFISIVPNLVPLAITAALMGFMGVPLKPSTALIFSVAFGISVDDSIHFLAKYRQELFANNFFVPVALSKSIRETGASMMYTSLVLFFGFIIFGFSQFGGTKSLGLLTSTTLLIAMFTNLILLPSLLLIFDDGKRNKDEHPPIEHYDEFYQEDEDEEIDIELIEVEKEK
ncbi:MAG: MMPL family transporter [Cyclobacteriaceae bacterium]|nr:MMPL family transporter [Cyclobacteriaceae bacterium]